MPKEQVEPRVKIFANPAEKTITFEWPHKKEVLTFLPKDFNEALDILRLEKVQNANN